MSLPAGVGRVAVVVVSDGLREILVATGKIVRFDRVRGYGFIAPDNGGEDVFMHMNDLEGDEGQLSVGTRVSFDVVDGERGLKAYGVQVLEAARPAPRSYGPSRPADHEELCEVLSPSEFTQKVTELLIDAAPEMTAKQIVSIRSRLAEFARSNGWVD